MPGLCTAPQRCASIEEACGRVSVDRTHDRLDLVFASCCDAGRWPAGTRRLDAAPDRHRPRQDAAETLGEGARAAGGCRRESANFDSQRCAWVLRVGPSAVVVMPLPRDFMIQMGVASGFNPSTGGFYPVGWIRACRLITLRGGRPGGSRTHEGLSSTAYEAAACHQHCFRPAVFSLPAALRDMLRTRRNGRSAKLLMATAKKCLARRRL